MKNKNLVHYHESARIYRNYYKPSFNFIRLLKSVLSIVISGNNPVATDMYKRK